MASDKQFRQKLREPDAFRRATQIIEGYWPYVREETSTAYQESLFKILGNESAAVVCVLLHVWAETGHDFPPSITEMLPIVSRFRRWHRQAHEEYLKHEEAVRAAS